jgi:DNA polymerase III subunit delta'
VARKRAVEAVAEATLAERLVQAAAPWLAPARAQLQAAWQAGRFPHALLIHGRPGLGQAALALWTANLGLCESATARPCGACGGCTLFRAGNHPDYHPIQIEDDASVIKVDQIRELATTLSMRSYRGGMQVATIDAADTMNTNAFNALLKTLEEPSQDTLLVLAASRLERLPRTIVSRCQRLPIALPANGEAMTWLSATEPRSDWSELLALASGAPLAALELSRNDAAALGTLLRRELAGLEQGSFDPLALADAWQHDRPAQRLRWLEHWTEIWLREALGTGDAINNNQSGGLPRPVRGGNIPAVFAFLDRLREVRGALEGPLNTQLLLEDLLTALGETFATVTRRTG